jgi:hypothetical protein
LSCDDSKILFNKNCYSECPDGYYKFAGQCLSDCPPYTEKKETIKICDICPENSDEKNVNIWERKDFIFQIIVLDVICQEHLFVILIMEYWMIVMKNEIHVVKEGMHHK